MGFPAEERAVLLRTHLMGPKMVLYLEAVGIASLSQLAQHDAGTLRLAINAHLGRAHINAMGERALDHAIARAREHLR